MVIEFADQCKSADYKLTLTGSWIQDRQDYPGFWSDVYLYWLVEASQEQQVEATIAVVNSSG